MLDPRHYSDRSRATVEPLERRSLLAVVPAGPQFRVNTFTAGDQFATSVASDSAGNFVVVWASDGQDGSNFGVYAQRYNSAGVAQGSEFRVNTFTTGQQSLPAVAMDSSGDFVVSWTSDPADSNVQASQDGSGAGVYARRYNASGAALDAAEFRVNTFTTGNQEASRVAMDSTGDFVIVWDSNGQDGSGYGVFAQRYNAAGTAQGGEFQVNQFTTNLQADPSVAMDSAGDFVIAWTSGNQTTGQDGSFYGIYARRYNAAGVAQGNEFRVNTFTTDFQTFASVAMDTSGDFVIAWNSYGQDNSQYGVYAQRYNSSGVAQAGEFRVNTFTTGQQSMPSVDMDGAGGFTIVWSSAGQDGSGRGVYAQSYDSSGNPSGAEFRANTTTSNSQTRPSIALDTNGDAIIAWQDGSQTTGVNGADGSGYGIFAQRYTAAADTTPPMVTSATFNYLTSQSLTIAFSENVSASLSPSDIVVQNLTNSTTVSPALMNIAYNTSNNTATVTFSGLLADGNYRVTLLSSGITDAAGNHLDGDHNGTAGGDYTFDFFVLAGDANHDRIVDVTDLGVLATFWQSSGVNFSQGDFNYDGVVNVTDLGILATNWQKVITAPVSAPAFAMSIASKRDDVSTTTVADDVLV